MDNILTSLNAGSGIDVRALVANLVEAERAPRQALLDNRQERVESRISAMGQFRSALDALVGALASRISSGSLAGIATVSRPDIMSLSVNPGATVQRQQLEVRQLARIQTLASAPVADAAAPVGQGALIFRFGSVAGTTDAMGFTPGALADLVVTIGPDDDSLTGLRNAINDAAAVAGSPVQAQIVSDVLGSRLLLRGSFGEASGFVVQATGDPALGAFGFDQGATAGLARTQSAADSVVALAGLELRRPSNIINDLVPGARITLSRAEAGALVTIGAEREPLELARSVRDLAGALNELSALGRQLSARSNGTGSAGALVSDGATRRALLGLSGITMQQLAAPEGRAPTRLADIGLTLDRNGNFIIDETRLTRAVNDHPATVEQIYTALNRATTITTPGGPLRQIAAQFAVAAQGPPGQQTALQRESLAIARERGLLDARTQRAQENYTRQFAALDRAVGQSRALQDFMTRQIDLWTNQSGR